MNEQTLTVMRDVRGLVERAREFTIDTPTDAEAVAGFLLGIKALRARIGDVFNEHITRAHTAHLALVREKRAAEEAAIEAEGVAKALLVAYRDQQQRAADVERRRVDVEYAAERARVLDAAAAAAAAGDYGHADDLREEAARVTAVVALTPPTPKVEGVAFRETWTARVTDLGALVRAAAATPSLLAFLKPDMPRLHAQARALRARMAIPGVDAVSQRTVAASGRGREDGNE